MYLGSALDIRAVLGIVAVEVGGVLEIVSVERTVRERLVGQYIVVIYLYVEGISLFLQCRLDMFEYLSVRGRGSSYNYRLYGRSCFCLAFRSRGAFLRLSAAACKCCRCEG